MGRNGLEVFPSGQRMPQQKPDVRVLKWSWLPYVSVTKYEKSSREPRPAR